MNIALWLLAKPYWVASFAGALVAFFALAPFSQGWLFFLFTPLMMWLLDTQQGKKAFWLGFTFGFSYNLIAFYWIGHAFLLSHVPFLIPVSIIGLPALFGLYWGLAFFAARSFWSSPLEKIISFTFFWSIAFWAQGTLWTGFPWNFPAQSWILSLSLSQNFHWLGFYGANFVMILISASFFILLTKEVYKFYVAGASFVLLASLWGYGAVRLAGAETKLSETDIVIIQPNILQERKWDRRFARDIISTYFQLTQLGARSGSPDKPTVMLWPEAALPVNIEKSPKLLKAFSATLPKSMILVAGFVRFAWPKNFNSLFVFNNEGETLSIYDKNHLVPFGEYLPLQGFLESLGAQQITGSAGGYGAGKTRDLLPTDALPLICFEISFSNELRHAQQTKRAKWIANITNDGWYRDSPGPYQHFQLAQIRAIEFGLPVARAANTGISALIDPYGRVVKKLPLETQGLIRATLPAPLPPTLYVWWGEWLFILFLVLAAAVLFTLRSRESEK